MLDGLFANGRAPGAVPKTGGIARFSLAVTNRFWLAFAPEAPNRCEDGVCGAVDNARASLSLSIAQFSVARAAEERLLADTTPVA